MSKPEDETLHTNTMNGKWQAMAQELTKLHMSKLATLLVLDDRQSIDQGLPQ